MGKRSFRCEVLAWHSPDKSRRYDTVNTHSKCKRCGRHIMLDSQGNWF